MHSMTCHGQAHRGNTTLTTSSQQARDKPRTLKTIIVCCVLYDVCLRQSGLCALGTLCVPCVLYVACVSCVCCVRAAWWLLFGVAVGCSCLLLLCVVDVRVRLVCVLFVSSFCFVVVCCGLLFVLLCMFVLLCWCCPQEKKTTTIRHVASDCDNCAPLAKLCTKPKPPKLNSAK